MYFLIRLILILPVQSFTSAGGHSLLNFCNVGGEEVRRCASERQGIVLQTTGATMLGNVTSRWPKLEGNSTMLNKMHRELGIPRSYSDDKAAPLYGEPDDLVSIGLDIFERPQYLSRQTAERWWAMHLAASNHNVELLVVSAFRSIDYQASIIRRKIEKGLSIEFILQTNAAPGHSEHHSGRALDLTALNCKPLCEEFEHTEAFHWLSGNACRFGFTLSYPRENEHGMIYEPWHWCHNNV